MLIIGCGNTDGGDDAAGVLVARRLNQLDVDAIEHSGDGLALLDLWTGDDEVIVIDAISSVEPAGSVCVWESGEIPSGQLFLSSTHQFGLNQALELGGILGRLPPRLTIYGISAGQFEPGAPPSDAVLAAIERVARQIRTRYSD